MRHLISALYLATAGSVFAQFSGEITEKALIEDSPIIAIVEVRDAPQPMMDNASVFLPIWKQRAKALRRESIKGVLPDTFVIENEEDSIISDGLHLVFLKPLSDTRFILSTPISFRKIIKGEVYWFPPGFVSLEDVLQRIGASIR